MGGGIGMGNTCKPMAVSFQCMTKFTTNKKNKNKKKINVYTLAPKKKKKRNQDKQNSFQQIILRSMALKLKKKEV